MESITCDFAIVGGGTAGLALAARLSEIPEAEVVVVEAGGDLRSDPRITTPSMWRALLDTPVDWGYKTVPQKHLSGRELACPQGRLLGGTSALNALVFSVNAKSNIEAWEQLGNPGWAWADFEANLQKVYTLTKPSEAAVDVLGLNYVGKDHEEAKGPLQLSWTDWPDDEWPRVWRDTFTNMGHPMTGDPFRGETLGVFFTAESIDPSTAVRSFAASSYLKQAEQRPNLRIISNASVTRILLDQTDPGSIVSTGLEFVREGSSSIEKIEVRKEVIITSGALKSPAILESSGIGSPQVCRDLGVPCIIDNPHVGENLQNHPICGMSFEVHPDCKTIDPLLRQEPAAIQEAVEQYQNGRGPLASSHIFSHCQLPFPNIASPDGKRDLEQTLKIQDNTDEQTTDAFAHAHRKYVESVLRSETEGSVIHFAISGYAAVGPDGSPAAVPEGNRNYYTISTLLAHPLSRGSVHSDKAAPHGIRIDPNFMSNLLDVEVFAHHIRRVEETIIKTEPLASKLVSKGQISLAKYPPGSLTDLETAREYVKDATFGAYHFTGSCSMMPRELGGVVDSRLRVHGCKNLRVCDASVMPLIPRANPQSSVYAIAEAANGFIRDDWYK